MAFLMTPMIMAGHFITDHTTRPWVPAPAGDQVSELAHRLGCTWGHHWGLAKNHIP